MKSPFRKRHILTWALALLAMGAIHVEARPDPPAVLWTYDAGSSIWTSPALAPDGTIYLSGNAGGLQAITNNGVSASNKWSFYANIQGSASVGPDGVIYFGVANTFFAIRPDGTQKWSLTTSNTYLSTPAFGLDGTIYFVASDSLYAVTPAGTVKWKFAIDGNTAPGDPVAPAIGVDGTIYVGGYFNRNFFAINPDGTEKWMFPEATSESPAIGSDGTIYLSLYSLRALTPNGALLWESPLHARAPAVVGRDGSIYVAASPRGSTQSLLTVTPTGSPRGMASRCIRPCPPSMPAA